MQYPYYYMEDLLTLLCGGFGRYDRSWGVLAGGISVQMALRGYGWLHR